MADPRLPPLTECPAWCAEPAEHPWVRDADTFDRWHHRTWEGDGWRVGLSRLDSSCGAGVKVGDVFLAVEVNDDLLTYPAAGAFAAAVAEANAMGAADAGAGRPHGVVVAPSGVGFPSPGVRRRAGQSH